MMNDHIEIHKIDTYTRQEFGINKYDDSIDFYNWLEAQTVRFDNAKQALKVYRGIEEMPIETNKENATPRYTEQSFKSRQQLNSFLRRNGYTWNKVSTFGEWEESEYGESFRWALLTSDGRELTVSEALSEIS